MEEQMMQALQQMSPEELQMLIQAASQVLQMHQQSGMQQGAPMEQTPPQMRTGGYIRSELSRTFNARLKAKRGLRF
jgi:hypothetical protein